MNSCMPVSMKKPKDLSAKAKRDEGGVQQETGHFWAVASVPRSDVISPFVI